MERTAHPGRATYGTQPDCADSAHPMAQGHGFCLVGRFAEAAACFRDAIAAAPASAMAHNNLGWALQGQGMNDAALLSYNAALALDPALILARANLAFLLAHLYNSIGKLQQARAMWLALVELYPEDGEVIDQLIGTALRLHDLPDAARWADRYAALAGPASRVTPGKLVHDRKQARYLRAQGLAGAECADGKIAYRYPAPRVDGGALSPASTGAEAGYLQNQPRMVVVDNFLVPAALAQLQQFCLASTVWQRDHYAYDRLGAFFRDGFHCPLLLQIAEEIRAVFPQVIGRHPLLQMWGYKYRHDQPAMPPHADFAAVNVNFWITPDAANLDRTSGGLVIYDQAAPAAWDFDAYNRQGGRIAAFLAASGAASTVIPYRCNRAVVFDSDLFHATAPLAFRPGYAHQRINITMLYGERKAR